MGSIVFNATAAILIGLALGACEGSDSYSPTHGITDDVTASRWSGPTSLNPGQSLPSRDEPNGATPWQTR
jgi:hypothetical protein